MQKGVPSNWSLEFQGKKTILKLNGYWKIFLLNSVMFGNLSIHHNPLPIVWQIFVNLRAIKQIHSMITEVAIINDSGNPLPFYATADSAGLDLYANIQTIVGLGPLERTLIPTGIRIALPRGTEAQIRPRSGLAVKKGLGVLNSPGTIDSDYRGEIKILLVNLSNEKTFIEPGERIAQMVVSQHCSVKWKEVDQLPDSMRGEGGFGSTGTK